MLNLRLPGYDLWAVQAPEKSFAVLGVTLLGTQFFRSIEYLGYWDALTASAMAPLWVETGVMISLSVLVAAIFTVFSGRTVFKRIVFSGNTDRYRIVYVLMPLIFAWEAGFQLEKLFTIGGRLLPILGGQLGLAVELPSASASPLTMKTAQVLAVMLGAIGALSVLVNMLRGQAGEGKKQLPPLGNYWPILLLALAYVLIFLLR